MTVQTFKTGKTVKIASVLNRHSTICQKNFQLWGIWVPQLNYFILKSNRNNNCFCLPALIDDNSSPIHQQLSLLIFRIPIFSHKYQETRSRRKLSKTGKVICLCSRKSVERMETWENSKYSVKISHVEPLEDICYWGKTK